MTCDYCMPDKSGNVRPFYESDYTRAVVMLDERLYGTCIYVELLDAPWDSVHVPVERCPKCGRRLSEATKSAPEYAQAFR